ncbi:STAS domain-containing protein [Nocardioides panacis]|uniref:STAS domain-containing protein n=1 Tax=Nocardioides panacis TaxID=2849501 RepID=A0A975T075_9ACTN|nr:STAS domain-containing protein [Nocardioides panacis]QWZ08640.1 STAS domain-containing protein [Nocardioides panacis]
MFLDVAGLTFCDVEGCRMLAQFRTEIAAAGCDVRIIHASPIIRKVMDLIGAEVELATWAARGIGAPPPTSEQPDI